MWARQGLKTLNIRTLHNNKDDDDDDDVKYDTLRS